MQAIRHCSMCSSAGGLLQSRTDFLLLRTNNMASLRRGVACLNFFRSTATAIGTRKPSRQRFTDVARTSVVSFSVGSALSAVPCFTHQVENLTHESLVRRASSMVTDSANTYLSQTTLAVVDAITQYAKALHTLIALQRRYLASLGKMNPAEEDSIWQVIIGQRVQVDDRLDELKRYESNWMNAVNLCKMAAEAAYMAGAEQAANTTKINTQVSQSQVEEARQLSLDAERKLAEIKADEIQRMAEYAAFLDRNGEEFPEQYLRED